jgi:hypothetical protein
MRRREFIARRSPQFETPLLTSALLRADEVIE